MLRLLDLFRSSVVQMALVVDEYGSFEGIVTTTDILAAIAGEFPEDEGDAESTVVRRDDGSWLIDGGIDIDQLERLLNRRDLKSNDYHTLPGSCCGDWVTYRKSASASIGKTFASRWSAWTAAASTAC